jgi:quinolinate synthase
MMNELSISDNPGIQETQTSLKDKIEQLKKEKNAVILAQP